MSHPPQAGQPWACSSPKSDHPVVRMISQGGPIDLFGFGEAPRLPEALGHLRIGALLAGRTPHDGDEEESGEGRGSRRSPIHGGLSDNGVSGPEGLQGKPQDVPGPVRRLVFQARAHKYPGSGALVGQPDHPRTRLIKGREVAL